MQKITLLIILCMLYTTNILSQTYYQITTGNTSGHKYLIASLPKTGASNYQKLRIEILGGNFYNNNLGSRTYSISSRNGNGTDNLIRITQEQRGGSADNYVLKVYETASNFDFVLETTKIYTSILAQTWFTSGVYVDKPVPISMQEIKNYTSTSGVDITDNPNLVQFNYIYTTNNDGDIGIGTISPKSKLDVRGKIIANEVEIKVNKGWADFVFNPDYNLKSLSEVEAFIQENKHLPEIPSEKEVIENGINIGEMQSMLLQKIEELTLYMIEQDKKYNDLNRKYESVKQELRDLKKE